MTIKLIVGLANPGKEYTYTRHNAGAWFVNKLAKHNRFYLKENLKFHGYTAKINILNNDIHLLVPTTFINLSGKAVAALSSFYHIQPNEILIAHDELNLAPNVVKLKLGGSNGGHNGLKDIQKNLSNNPKFYRLRIGIGHPGDKNKVINFVLSKPSIHEKILIDNAIDKAVNYTNIIFREGIDRAMTSMYNN
ncbi:Peptidyl-tRNA hydrolase [Candidatus Profftia lariciata]|uniref:aminoacyl-tRNA hydrolase n=1 Tax=Candidatus Profftia lariciata TaxID=1987921 RepID=UPI001D00C48F|nr:aminoacyl-tRNA hydrolase [Candidatus Profftia lariciata]UDG81699.1 Peptidyl-tRNA hydrolase [Candidatus Profftia lariciata]